MALIKIIFSPSVAALASSTTTFLFNLDIHAKANFVLFRGEVGGALNSQAATSEKRIFNCLQTATPTTTSTTLTHSQRTVFTQRHPNTLHSRC